MGRVGGLYAAWLPLGMVGVVLAGSFGKKRRRMWLLGLLVIVTTILPAACGGGSSSGSPPAVARTFTVTVTSGAIQHSINVTVTVR